MSHSHNFVSELVIMAKAMEELPIVKAELEQAYQRTTEQAETIQRLELRILDMKNGYDTLSHSMSKMEADRDEAVKAFLEADDRAQQAVGFIRSAMSNAASFLQAVEPAPAVPVVQPEVSPDSGVQDSLGIIHGVSEPAQPPVGGDVPGQSEHNPTSTPTEPSTVITPEPTVNTTGDATNIDSVASGPFVGNGGGMSEPLGPTEQTSDVSPATNTDAASNTTFPDAVGSSGNTDSGQSAAGEPTAQVEPIASGTSATSHGANESENASQLTTTNSSVADDVGYHNEPTSSQEWFSWCERMDRRYGMGTWPARGFSTI